ncbi:hypothetical protein [Reyranella sp.]|jgi:class 3 adenylate cyclase|uniref:hypothetical protein n=1 Tax=Reyranella sp. TaxID=1929291 RepID=UPI002F958C34
MQTIADPAPEGQASKVFGTIMVGRFEGFPSLVHAVGQPAMAELARRVHETLGYYIHQYKGTVVQSRGDGLIAVFTTDDGDDGHATRALAAAIAIRRAFASEFMTVRTSVHSGLVTVPATVGIARSLGEMTADNRINASDRTVELTREYFEFRSVGMRQVDGMGEVGVFEVLAVARNHAGRLNSYLHAEHGPGDDGDSIERSFPVLCDIIQSVRH